MNVLLLITTILCYCICVQCTPIEPTFSDVNESPDPDKFILSTMDHNAEVPRNGIVVQPHENFTANMPEDHVLNTKKIVALPVQDVKADTEVLSNSLGHAVVAKPTNNSDEDMMTAENIVFRPLFAYKRKKGTRRRVYVPVDRNSNINIYPYIYQPTNVYPVYYPVYYRNAKQSFPAVT